jgi:hypothetical protein
MSKEDKTVVWAFVGSLATVKLLTSILILYYFPSWHTLGLVVILSLFWIAPPLYYLGLYVKRYSDGRYRLIRARRRRKELVRQEWEIEDPKVNRRL